MSNCKLCLVDCAFKGKDMKKGNCKGYIPMSNADRIRAMSAEELLDFMKKSVANAYMCKIMRTEPMFLTLDWLQQPVKENT